MEGGDEGASERKCRVGARVKALLVRRRRAGAVCARLFIEKMFNDKHVVKPNSSEVNNVLFVTNLLKIYQKIVHMYVCY